MRKSQHVDTLLPLCYSVNISSEHGIERKEVLNVQEIKNLQVGEVLWDKGSPHSVKGLHVKAFAPHKSFYLYYRTQSGVQRRPKLGEVGILSLDDAREIAREMLLLVAQGKDPSLHRQESRGEMTVERLFNECWQSHWDVEKYRLSGHSREVKKLYENNVRPTFGSSKLSDVTGARVRIWHKSMIETPFLANRAKEVLSRLFSFAEEMEWKPQNTNPCKIVKSFKERKRDRYATEEEIKKIADILGREEATRAREVAFLYLLIFTGSRPSAIERAKRESIQVVEVDGRNYGVLGVEGKTGEERIVFPPKALEILSSLPSPIDGSLTGIKMPSRFWRAVKKEAGCPDLWARDWRRTFATTGMSEGFDMNVISELLNHKSTQTTKIYAKLNPEKRTEIAGKTAEKLERIMSGK